MSLQAAPHHGPSTTQFPPVMPYHPHHWPTPSRTTSPVVIVLLTVLTIAVTAVGAALIYLVVGRTTSAGSSATAVTSTVVTTAVAAPTATPVQAVAPVDPAPAIAPSAAYTECSDAGGARFAHAAIGTSVTSCAFAQAVRSSYLASGASGSSTSVSAYSPVTGMSYSMWCSGGAVVECTGGNNAVVYIY